MILPSRKAAEHESHVTSKKALLQRQSALWRL